MTTTIISNSPPYNYGQLTNQSIGRLVSLNANMQRLQEAIATASSGYDGTPGTEFEIGNVTNITNTVQNLFGVQASTTPGEQGAAYSYAVGQLHAAWETFWQQAAPYIEQLDNGTYG